MRNILLVTKGHPYERQPFYQMFDDMDGVDYTLVEQPAAQALFSIEEGRAYDAYVLYDMPGIRFRGDAPPDFLEPPKRYRDNFEKLIEAGHGFVFLHHAIAGWPAWEGYAEIMGGRFLYLPASMRGLARQDSGYRHRVTHNISVVADHPVTAGVPASFPITDELYLYEVFEEDVQPLLRSDYDFTEANFYSAARAVAERRMFSNEGWKHPAGTNLIGWTRTLGKSRIVYLQCGDDPVAYASQPFRQLIRNAIQWVADRGNG
ncbi:MAG: ThuA domain-containing protein [Gammaproteobacteria bacterium]|nr:ThuA domain-containing protein [Gammaproteobacteria bacterium]